MDQERKDTMPLKLWGFRKTNYLLKFQWHKKSLFDKSPGIRTWWGKKNRFSQIWIIQVIQAQIQCKSHCIAKKRCKRYRILLKRFRGCHRNCPLTSIQIGSVLHQSHVREMLETIHRSTWSRWTWKWNLISTMNDKSNKRRSTVLQKELYIGCCFKAQRQRRSPCKWVLRKKRDADGIARRDNAKLSDFGNRDNEQLTNLFVPLVNFSIPCLLLAIAA